MDSGSGFNEIDAALVNDKPYLREYQITSFLGTDTGSTFDFYLEATNVIGTVASDSVSFVLASVPD